MLISIETYSTYNFPGWERESGPEKRSKIAEKKVESSERFESVAEALHLSSL